MSKIVVGVDGSAESLAALRWAAQEARLRGARLCVVHAWFMPMVFTSGPPLLVLPETREELGGEGGKVLSHALEAAAADVEGLTVERSVVEGSAAHCLLRAAEGADLLVLGSRGHGGFHGLLLGSVSQQCAHHAPCPVVIVRPAR